MIEPEVEDVHRFLKVRSPPGGAAVGHGGCLLLILGGHAHQGKDPLAMAGVLDLNLRALVPVTEPKQVFEPDQ